MNGILDEAIINERRALELTLAPNERLHALLMLSHLEPSARETWLLTACAEFPDRREPWCELAQLHMDRGAWRACRGCAHTALRIVNPADDYLTNVFAWGPWSERLAALASLELGEHEWALHHARRAVRAAPKDPVQAELLAQAMNLLESSPTRLLEVRHAHLQRAFLLLRSLAKVFRKHDAENSGQ